MQAAQRLRKTQARGTTRQIEIEHGKRRRAALGLLDRFERRMSQHELKASILELDLQRCEQRRLRIDHQNSRPRHCVRRHRSYPLVPPQAAAAPV